MQNGTYILPHVPFGYKMCDSKLIIEESEAKTIREIFKLYLSGIGINKIAMILNQQQPQKVWTYVAVRYILRNEKYTGNSLWHKTCTTETLPFKTIINKGYEDKYFVRNTHEEIISEEEFEKSSKITFIKII